MYGSGERVNRFPTPWAWISDLMNYRARRCGRLDLNYRSLGDAAGDSSRDWHSLSTVLKKSPSAAAITAMEVPAEKLWRGSKKSQEQIPGAGRVARIARHPS